jgi:hypothetical protein
MMQIDRFDSQWVSSRKPLLVSDGWPDDEMPIYNMEQSNPIAFEVSERSTFSVAKPHISGESGPSFLWKRSDVRDCPNEVQKWKKIGCGGWRRT